ncbi:MAG: mycoredoxin [Actinomycetes bacterium]
MAEETDNVGVSVSEVTVYSTPWCGHCKRLKTQLAREGIEFVDVDIETDPAAADIVAAANNGDHVVPTVVMADGTTLSNPSVRQIKEHLSS